MWMRKNQNRLFVFLQILLLLHLCCPEKIIGQTVASFAASSYSGCRPLNVQFTNTSTNATSYSWNFGNGNTSSQASPGNIYTNQGVYTVTLTANGPGGTNIKTAIITVVDPPVAGFSVSQTTACQNVGSISFTNNSTSYDSCVWDFGDGSTSSQINPTHIYQISGVFSVSLIAYNTANDCFDGFTMNQAITISPSPKLNITTNDSTTCDQNHVFLFSANSSNINQWHWDFGDGNTSTIAAPSHVYTDSGFYDIKLIATNSSGCSDTVLKNDFIRIKYNPIPGVLPYYTHGCKPLGNSFSTNVGGIIHCLWNAGDGFIDSSLTSYHTYQQPGSYTVQLNVTYNNGCTNQNSYSYVQVDSTPAFTYTFNIWNGCAPLSVQFSNSVPSAGYNWLWDFGDGTTSTLSTPSHTYTSNGAYVVSLSATNQYGCSYGFSAATKIKVTSPVAMFTADRTTGCAPLTVNFNNQSVDATQYLWDFGDGNTSTLASPAHIYQQPGTYIIKLIARDNSNCSDTLIYNQSIAVSLTSSLFAVLPPVVACSPFTVNFQDNSISSSWLWNFGDGATSTLQNPAHTYTTAGNYTVSLSTQGANGGCSQNISNLRNIIINGATPQFSHSESHCPPYQAIFTDSSVNAVSWLWSFDDGSTSVLQNPSHIFSIPGYHTVALTVTTSQGCKATIIKDYEVYFEPLVAHVTTFVADTTLPISVQFYSNSIGATHWFWSFGDGDSSFLENPVHVYSSAGPYTLSLTIWNDTCTHSYVFPPVTFGGGVGNVGGTPIGNLPLTPIYNCAPFEMNFTNPYQNVAIANWDFGDGQTSTQINPTHLYTAGGDYQVKLFVQTTSGAFDSVYFPNIVHIDKFDADFTINSTSSCAGNHVNLIPADTTASCLWDLGNGLFLNSKIGNYTYSNTNSNYLISLLATDTNGCSASASQTFYASQVDPLSVSASNACAGDTLYFGNQLNYGSYTWDFGDGTLSNYANPFHVYQDSGIFQVTLHVSDSTGCSKIFNLNQQIQVLNPHAYFTIQNITSACTSIKVDFTDLSTGGDNINWDFGNGQYSTVPRTYVSYYVPGTYYISLTVSKSICSSTYTSSVPIVMPSLNADFAFTQIDHCLPITQAFVDSSRDAVSWNWSFGDGASDSTSNPVHIFNSTPNSSVKLTVKDIYGCTKSVSKPNINVTKANFKMNTTSGCTPLTVAFTDSSLNAISWQWDFGDGSFSNLQNPAHQYVANGKYTVKLIAESQFGCFDTIQMDSVIQSGSINSGFTADLNSGCSPLLVQFTELSSNATSWIWDFGDGNNSNLQNPAHVYNQPGSFHVLLVAIDSLGCTDTIKMQNPVMIYGSQPNFTVLQNEGCTPLSLGIVNQSIGAISYQWNFGNGVIDTVQNPVYSFAIPGDYTVTLQTTDTSGCISTFTYPSTIKVHQKPTAFFTLTDFNGCTPFSLNINNQSQNADSIIWNFGNGNMSNDINPQYIYNQAGSYELSLYAINPFGCNDTFIYPDPIVVNLQPHAGFQVSDSVGCLPFGIQFTNTCTDLDSANYSWILSNGTTSSLPDPYINFTSAATFDVTLIVTNKGGCHDDLTMPGLINVYDPLPPPPTQLYSVSVIDTSKVEVKWKKINLNDVDFYTIFRLNHVSGQYDSIAVYYQQGIQTPNIIQIADVAANTLTQTNSYRILATDKCGSKLLISDLTEHTTIFIKGVNNGSNINLNWSPYGGCNVDGYDVYRSDDNGITFHYLGSTNSSVLSFKDTTTYCPFIYQYKVMATGICGEAAATSFSNIAKVDHSYYTWQQTNNITRATVVDNSYILIEWGQTATMPQTVIGYDIFRSIDNINFHFYIRVGPSQYYLEDRSVDIQRKNYYYKVAPVNMCDIINKQGAEGSSILLKGDYDPNGKSLLRWTPYKEWADGVDHYVLEKLNKFGIWERVKTTDPNTMETDDE